MPHGRVLISMILAAMGCLVVTPPVARGQAPGELAQLRHLNHLPHLSSGLVAAELRAGEEADNDADDVCGRRLITASRKGRE